MGLSCHQTCDAGKSRIVMFAPSQNPNGLLRWLASVGTSSLEVESSPCVKGLRPTQIVNVGQSLGLCVIDGVNVSTIVPTHINPKAWVSAAEGGHADRISG